MNTLTRSPMSVADAARLAALRRPYGDGMRSYAWFLRRKVAQVSAAKMASELGVHPQTLRAYEANTMTPSDEIAVKYLRILAEIEKYNRVQETRDTRKVNRRV